MNNTKPEPFWKNPGWILVLLTIILIGISLLTYLHPIH